MGQDQRTDATWENPPARCPPSHSDGERDPPRSSSHGQPPLLLSSHSPVKHCKDNGYLVVHPEHPNLAETTEESSKGCFVSWGVKTAEVESPRRSGIVLSLVSVQITDNCPSKKAGQHGDNEASSLSRKM